MFVAVQTKHGNYR